MDILDNQDLKEITGGGITRWVDATNKGDLSSTHKLRSRQTYWFFGGWYNDGYCEMECLSQPGKWFEVKSDKKTSDAPYRMTCKYCGQDLVTDGNSVWSETGWDKE